MPDCFNDPQMQQYFASLPMYVQETIKQSAVKITTENELRKFAENLMGSNLKRKRAGSNDPALFRCFQKAPEYKEKRRANPKHPCCAASETYAAKGAQ